MAFDRRRQQQTDSERPTESAGGSMMGTSAPNPYAVSATNAGGNAGGGYVPPWEQHYNGMTTGSGSSARYSSPWEEYYYQMTHPNAEQMQAEKTQAAQQKQRQSAQRAQQQAQQTGTGDDYLDKLLKGYNTSATNYVNGVSTRYGENYENVYHGDTADYLTATTDSRNSLSQQAEAITNYLYNVYGADSDLYTSITEALNGDVDTFDQILEMATQDNDYWTQFADEDDFNYFNENGRTHGMEQKVLEETGMDWDSYTAYADGNYNYFIDQANSLTEQITELQTAIQRETSPDRRDELTAQLEQLLEQQNTAYMNAEAANYYSSDAYRYGTVSDFTDYLGSGSSLYANGLINAGEGENIWDIATAKRTADRRYAELDAQYGGWENAKAVYDELADAYENRPYGFTVDEPEENGNQATNYLIGGSNPNNYTPGLSYLGASQQDQDEWAANQQTEREAELAQYNQEHFEPYGFELGFHGEGNDDYEAFMGDLYNYIWRNRLEEYSNAEDFDDVTTLGLGETFGDLRAQFISGYEGPIRNFIYENTTADYLSDEQQHMYSYIYRTQGKDEADAYLQYISPALNKKRVEDNREYSEQLAREHPWWAFLNSVAGNVLSGVGLIDATIGTARSRRTGEYDPYDFNSSAMDYSRMTSDIRGEQARIINGWLANSSLTDADGRIYLDPEQHKYLAPLLNGKGLGDIYQLGASIVDSYVNMNFAGAVGKVFGAGAASAAGAMGTMALGGSAGTSGMLEALERGATDEQAIAIGWAYGTAEALFEYLSLEKVVNGETGRIIHDWLANSAVEGSEEVFTSIANMVSDAVIMGENSEAARRMAELVAGGMTEEDAWRAVAQEQLLGLFWDFAGGFISGGGHTLLQGGVNYVSNQFTRAENSTDLIGLANKYGIDTSKYTQRMDNRKSGQLNMNEAAKLEKGINEAEQKLRATAVKDAFEGIENAEELAGIAAKAHFDSEGKVDTSYFTPAERRAYNEAMRNETTRAAMENALAVAKHYDSGTVKAFNAENVKNYTTTENKKETAHKVSSVYIAEDGTIKARVQTGANFETKSLKELPDKVKNLIEYAETHIGDKKAAVAAYNEYNGQMNYAEYVEQAATVVLKASATNYTIENGKFDSDISRLGEGAVKALVEIGKARQADIAQRIGAKEAAKPVKNGGGVTVLTQNETHNGYTFKAVDESKLRKDSNKKDFTRYRRIKHALQAIGKALKLDIRLYDSRNEDGTLNKKAPNGMYLGDSRTIYVDIFAKMTETADLGRAAVTTVLSHELTHFMQNNDPATYLELKQFIVEKMSTSDKFAAMLARNITSREAQKNKDTFGYAEDELVARACENMLTNSEVIAEMIRSEPTLYGKIKAWFDNVMDAIREAADYAAEEAAFMSQYADEMQKIWDKGIKLAAEAESTARQTGTEQNTAEVIEDNELNDEYYSGLMEQALYEDGVYHLDGVDYKVTRGEDGKYYGTYSGNHFGTKVSGTVAPATTMAEVVEALEDRATSVKIVQNENGEFVVAKTESGHTLSFSERDNVTATVNVEGQTTSVQDENGHGQFSLRTWRDGGRDELIHFLGKRVAEGSLTQEELNEMIQQMDDIYKVCEDYAKEFQLFGEWAEAEVVVDPETGLPVFSVVKANGDYAMNLDFSLVCKKRRTLDAVFNEMISQGIMDDFEMREGSIATINDIIREHDFETACALCFVDSKRYRQALVADSFVRMYNPLVRSMAKKGQTVDFFNFGGDKRFTDSGKGIHTLDDSELDFTEINKVLATAKPGTVQYKIAQNLKENPSDRRCVLRGDFMSTAGFDNLKQNNGRVLSLYNSKKGAGGPKAAQSDVQYLSEILHNTKFKREAAYAVGGVRIQSFSDYVPRLVFDYVQMIQDLAAKQLPAHAYTKEPMFVMQFGKCNIKINMSLVPAVVKNGIAPGLDEYGNYAWKDGQSFGSTVYGGSKAYTELCYNLIGKEYNGQDRLTAAEGYELAKVIQSTQGYSQNCGTIAVGVSKAHITKLLADPNIRMVIPYHKSSLNHLVAQMNGIDKYVDFTTDQNTKYKATNKKINKSDDTFSYNDALRELGDAKAAAQAYLDWCEEHDYIPKFREWAADENYYKLLEDFTCYDNDVAVPQGDVTLNLPTAEDAFGSFTDLIRMGLEEDAILQGKQDAAVPAIVDAIKKTLPEYEANAKQTKKGKKGKKTEQGQFSERDDVNSTMTMDQAKRMLESAFNVYNIRRDYGYKNINEWIENDGVDSVALSVESDYNIYQKYLSKLEELGNEYTLEDIIQAYVDGTLVGKAKPKANRLDTSKGYNVKDNRFYAPSSPANVTAETWQLANTKITNANKDNVTAARREILFFAHNNNITEKLGITSAELFKKLRSWSAYTKQALTISNKVNEGVAPSNRWTGIENSSFLKKTSVTDADIRSLVKDIKGESSEYQRSYIGRAMLALDTHINWSGITFDFKRGRADPNRGSVRGMYSMQTSTVTIGGSSGSHTVAHEMGHALDNIWFKDIFGEKNGRNDYLSETIYKDSLIEDADARQFVQNFRTFIDSLTDTGDIHSAYTQEKTETFARFVAKFVEWVDYTAGSKFLSDDGYFKDKFTASQYYEFVKLLQEKSMLDSKRMAAENVQFADRQTANDKLLSEYNEKYADIERKLSNDRRAFEGAEAFTRRNGSRSYKVQRKGNLCIAYSSYNQPNYSAKVVGRILKKYGAEYFYYNEAEINFRGVTERLKTYNACTLGSTEKIIGISKNLTILPKIAANHELYHYYAMTPQKAVFDSILEENIIKNAEYWAFFDEQLLAYYGEGNTPKTDSEWESFYEDVKGNIVGYLNHLGYEHSVRKFLKDFDTVKAAWENMLSNYDVQNVGRLNEDANEVKLSEREDIRSDAEILNEAFEDSAKTEPERKALNMYHQQVEKHKAAEQAYKDALAVQRKEKAASGTVTKETRQLVTETHRAERREFKVLQGMITNNASLRKVINAERVIDNRHLTNEMKAQRAEYNAKYKELNGIIRGLESERRADVKTAYEAGVKAGIFEQKVYSAEQLAKQKEALTKKASERLNALRTQRDNKLAQQAEYYRDMQRRQRERRAEGTIRNKIKKMHGELVRMIEHPSENKYIPKELLEPTVNILEALVSDKWQAAQKLQRLDELEAQRLMSNAGVEEVETFTEADQAEYEKLLKSKEFLEGRRDAFAREAEHLAAVYEKVTKNGTTAAYDDNVADMLKSLPEVFSENIYDMNEAQLTRVYNVLTALRKTIRDAAKLKLRNEELELNEVARGLIGEMKGARRSKNNFFTKTWWDSVRPQAVFERFGGYKKNSMWSKLYNLLNDGQLKVTQLTMELSVPFGRLLNNQKQIADFTGRTWNNKTDTTKLVDIGLHDADGNAILVSKEIAASIYMDTMNEQNARHMALGGKIIPNLDEYYKGAKDGGFGQHESHAVGFSLELSQAQRELAQIKEELKTATAEEAEQIEERIKAIEQQLKEAEANIDDINDKIDAYIEEVRSKCEELFNRKGNEYIWDWIKATRKLFDEDSKAALNEVTNEVYGFDRAEVENYFPIRTDPSFRTASFESIVRDASLENAGFMKERINGANPTLALGITDVVRTQIDMTARYCGMMPAVREFTKVYGKTAEGYTTSVQKELSKVMGKYGADYINKLMSNISGSRHAEGNPINSLLGALRGNLARATLTLSPRVALSQAASLPTASAVLGHKAIAYAFNPSVKVDENEIAKYTPLYWYRMQGYSTTELGDIKNSNKPLDRLWKKANFLTGWIQAMDGFATRRLWAASKYYVENTLKMTEQKNGEEYWTKVAEMYNKTIEETQPNYTTMQRPELLRNPDGLAKSLTMFSTQRLQNLSIVVDAAERYAKYNSDLKNKANGITEADVAEAKDKLASAVSSQMVQAAAIVGIKFITDMLMSNMKKYRDDDEVTAEAVGSALLDMYLDTIVGNFFMGSTFYGFFKALIGKGEWYDISVNGVDSINNIASDLNNFAKYVREHDNVDGSTLFKKFTNIVIDTSVLFGMPTNNAIKLGNAIRYFFTDLINGDLFTWEASSNTTKKQNTVRLITAMESGDTERVAELVETLGGEEDAMSSLKDYIRTDYKSKHPKYTEDEVMHYLVDFLGMSRSEAEDTIAYWDFTKENPTYSSLIKQETYSKYRSYVEPTGMSATDYVDIKKAADTNGKSGVSQEELGTYLLQLERAGVITRAQASAVWKASINSNTAYTDWLAKR